MQLRFSFETLFISWIWVDRDDRNETGMRIIATWKDIETGENPLGCLYVAAPGIGLRTVVRAAFNNSHLLSEDVTTNYFLSCSAFTCEE
jgi:hypothetical protein